MGSRVSALILPVVLTLASAASAAAQSSHKPPASQAADAFIGTWTLNVAKSTYEGQPAPKSGLRTFDYERDGMILTTAHSESAAGSHSFVHYLFTLDGKEYEEMTRSSGREREPRAPTYVSAKKIDDRNIEVNFTNGGKVIIAHAWTISDDGKTFIVKRKGTNAQGQPTYSVAVYEKR